ncbi:hypothetical protein GA0070606_0283 [Micromonospora citrea]|uniref:ABC-2 type transport system permease protein n=1 Tax=Micromonospora citrea TaxID=47855 RepID=A0A1C6TRQ0_9ACTN|nr:hypothetical protein [Micromonospora citrea]SCL44417.1 hypothetical protein GA0070606_0283 [Micromonospora citrea]
MTFARGFAAEVRKGLLNLVAAWREVLIQLITFPVFYLLIVLFMGRGQLRAELLLPTLLGMMALTFIHEQVNRVFWSYLGDIQSGVLEQTYLTPLPSAALILGRQVVAAISALPTALAVLATGATAITLRGGRVPFDFRVIVPLAAIVLGTCGLALILCGLTLVFKRIEIITQLSVALYAIAGGTLSCRPQPAGRADRTRSRGHARHPARRPLPDRPAERLGPRLAPRPAAAHHRRRHHPVQPARTPCQAPRHTRPTVERRPPCPRKPSRYDRSARWSAAEAEPSKTTGTTSER